MGETRKLLDGYLFESNQEFIKAKREKDVVEQMKKTVDWKNPATAYKLYQKILNKNSFTTVIGIQFLWELRTVVMQSGMKIEGELLPIKVKGMEITDTEGKDGRTVRRTSSAMSALQSTQVEKYHQIAEEYQTANKTKKIIIAFLILIIVGMLTVSQLTPYSIFTDYEEKIINQYEAWEKELKEREAALTEREEALKNQ